MADTTGPAAGRAGIDGATPGEAIGPVLRRRRLGRTLRELRATRAMTMEQAAEGTGLSRATVSRIEAAKQVILPRTIRLLAHAYDVDGAELDELLRQADDPERDQDGQPAGHVPDWLRRYVAEEADAVEITLYAAELVPGILQTPEYAAAACRAGDREPDDDEVGGRVALWLARRERLTDRQRLVAVVNEAALHRAVGGRAVLRAQLEFLAECARRPGFTVLVLPFDAGAHPATGGSFALLRFPADVGDPTVCLEYGAGAVYLDDPAQLAHREWVVARLAELALSPEDSLALIRKSAGGNGSAD